MITSQPDIILDSTLFPTRNVNYTATAGSTANYQRGPQGVMVVSSQFCYVEIGEGVTATTASFPMMANTVYRFIVPPGTGAPWRVSVIRNSVDGNFWARPINFN